MYSKLSRIVGRIVSLDAWSQNIGVARTLLALAGLSTLLLNATDVLIRPAAGLENPLNCTGLRTLSLWCVVPPDSLELGRVIGCVLLGLVAIGWRPAITAIPLAWILFSNQANLTVVDGGDQVASVLSILLLPISLTDMRKWHWTSMPSERRRWRNAYARVLAGSFLVVMQFQVCFIYLNSSLSKLGVTEWLNGSGIYYWMRNPMLGAPDYLQPWIQPITTNPLLVALITWSVLVLEFLLGISLVLPRRVKPVLFILGVLFHLAIGVFFGLWSFVLTMWAALLIGLLPQGVILTKRRVALWTEGPEMNRQKAKS